MTPGTSSDERAPASRGRPTRGCCGPSSSTTTSSATGSTGDPTQPPPPAGARRRAQQRLAAPLQPRRDLDAGQVGVPLVRRLGPGVPHGAVGARSTRSSPSSSSCCCCASGTCTPTASCPAYEFALRRRQPAGARLGLLAGLQDRPAARGARDRLFLERAFQKLLLNFTWWVNRKDAEGNNLFAGGFLGLDNIGVFDRSQPLPTGGYLEQADGTAWMAFYCATMLSIALELAAGRPGLRGHRLEVLRALRRHRRRHEQPRRHGAVGRGGRLLLRPAPCVDGHAAAAAGPFDGRADPAVRRRGAGRRRRSTGCRVPQADGVVPRQPRATWPGTSPTWTARDRDDARPPAAGDPVARAARARARATCWTRTSSSRRYGIRSLSPRTTASTPTCSTRRAASTASAYVPGEIDHRPVRRQLELARAGLVAGQLPADRGAGALPPLLRRRRCTVECPTGSGRTLNLDQVAEELATRLVRALPAGRQPASPRARRRGALRRRPALARPGAVLRVLPRRQRPRPGASHQTGWTALVASCIEYLGERR